LDRKESNGLEKPKVNQPPAEAARVLLVETDMALRKGEAALLREMGITDVQTASNGTDAWAAIKNTNVNFVISAWNLLEDMSGLVLLKVVRADRAFFNIPFMLVVEEITKGQVIEAGEAGITDIIIRPFTNEVFKRKIEGTLRPEMDKEQEEGNKLYTNGVEMMKQGRYDEAVKSFKKILDLHQSAEVYYNMGYIKTAQGRYEEAIIAFRKATQINNAFAQAFQKMGEVYARMGRSREAQKCFEQAAEIFMDKRMDDNAEAVFMQALKINPNTINVYNSLGILYRRQGRMEDSIKMYKKALRVSPFDEHIHYNYSRVLMAAKYFDEAARILQTALRLNPEFTEARNLLKSIEMGEGLR
jgi:Tfp pilus assembly protein PilF